MNRAEENQTQRDKGTKGIMLCAFLSLCLNILQRVKRFNDDAVGADLRVRPECRGGCFRADTEVSPTVFVIGNEVRKQRLG